MNHPTLIGPRAQNQQKRSEWRAELRRQTSFVRWNIIIFQGNGRLTCQACTVLSKGSILAQIIANSELVNPTIICSKNNWPDPVTAWLGICFVSLLTVLIVTSWGEKAERLKSIMPVSLGQAFPSEHHSRKRPFAADSHQRPSQESQRQV